MATLSRLGADEVLANLDRCAALACLRRVAQAAESGRRLGPGAVVVPPAQGAVRG